MHVKLNTFNLNNVTRINRLNWIHRVERKEPERIPKQLMGYTPRETRATGGLNLRWKDQPILQRNRSNGIERCKPRG
jgi:hypothetical protein